MKIKIKDKELKLIYCQSIYILFEEKFHTTLVIDQLSSYKTIADLFYCTIIASMEHKNNRDEFINFVFTEQDFKDWYNDDATILTHDFTKWFLEEVNNQMQLLQAHISEQEKEQETEEIDPKK